MITLYITSPTIGSGKTTLCCGLGKHLLDRGKKVGFFKPLIASASGTDTDTRLTKDVLSLAEPIESLSPVFANQRELETRVKETFGKVSSGKDIVLVDGLFDKKLPEILLAKVIIVEGYSKDTGSAGGYKDFGKNLLGVVINKVPANRLDRVRSEITNKFSQAGVSVLGMLPEVRNLLTLSIGELVGHIKGQFLSGADKSAELVSNIMLGPMSLDSGLFYFGRKDNKAVIIETKRTDMQLAALNTPVKCLVLVGDEPPDAVVLNFAEDKSVPVITAKGNMTSIVTQVEDALSQAGFTREKVPALVELMEKHLNFKELDKQLGI
ncbi:MAG: DRTGG domain-containing protein [Chloroflexota bacterium]